MQRDGDAVGRDVDPPDQQPQDARLLDRVQLVPDRLEHAEHFDHLALLELGVPTYRRFLGELSRINPQLKIIGLTATPYRLDSGMLHTGPEALFDDIAFEVSVRELIDQATSRL